MALSRPDLGDRTIFLTLAPIGGAQRRPESELWREFEIAHPSMLGALLDAAVHGLGALGRVHLDRLPRMADFALWAVACEPALWPAGGTFARLRLKPPSRHREHHRSRPHSHLRTYDDGGANPSLLGSETRQDMC